MAIELHAQVDWRKVLELKSDVLTPSLEKVCGDTLELYQLLQKQGDKKDLKNIYLSLLRTSVLLQAPWIRLDLMDDRGLEDLVECSAFWDISPVSQVVYKTFPLPEQYGNRDNKEYEVEKIWLD